MTKRIVAVHAVLFMALWAMPVALSNAPLLIASPSTGWVMPM